MTRSAPKATHGKHMRSFSQNRYENKLEITQQNPLSQEQIFSNSVLKLDLYDKKSTNKLKRGILSETSIHVLYLNRQASVILIVGLNP